MKYACIIFFCFLAVAFANDRSEKLDKIHESCQSDPGTKIQENTYDKLKKGKFVDDPNLPNHLFCMDAKIGLQKGNGDIDTTVLKKDLEKYITNAAKVDEIVSACGTRTAGQTAAETAMTLTRCINDHLD